MSQFVSELKIRIADINYGGHLAHDRLISLMHQARLDFLAHLGGSEVKIGGVGLIMVSLSVDYKNEAFLNETLQFSISTEEIKKASFVLNYEIKKDQVLIAKALTKMAGFDYENHKIQAFNPEFLDALKNYENK